MKKFIWGISIFWYGAIGNLITYACTLLHQSSFNEHEGWLVNFIANDTLIPLIFFIIVMVIGGAICIGDLPKHDENLS